MKRTTFSSPTCSMIAGVAGMKLGSPIVGLAATPSGKGYVIVTAKGRTFSFGGA